MRLPPCRRRGRRRRVEPLEADGRRSVGDGLEVMVVVEAAAAAAAAAAPYRDGGGGGGGARGAGGQAGVAPVAEGVGGGRGGRVLHHVGVQLQGRGEGGGVAMLHGAWLGIFKW